MLGYGGIDIFVLIKNQSPAQPNLQYCCSRQLIVGWVRRTRYVLGKQINLICVVTQHIHFVKKENILHQFKDNKLATRSCWVTAESIFSF
jgi:hypothetical protein